MYIFVYKPINIFSDPFDFEDTPCFTPGLYHAQLSTGRDMRTCTGENFFYTSTVTATENALRVETCDAGGGSRDIDVYIT